MQGIYDNDKAGKWKVIKDMTVIGAMRNPSEGMTRATNCIATLVYIAGVVWCKGRNMYSIYQHVDSL